MAQQTINSNSVQPLGIPNTGTSTEQGDTWDAAVVKLNAMFTELYSGNSTVAGNKTYTGTQTFNGVVSVEAGTGTGAFSPAGMLSRTVGPLTSGNTATSQTMASYTLPANTLASVGQEIEVTAWGVTAGNAAAKNIAMNIGGATFSTGTQTGSGYTWQIVGKFIKSSGNAQNYMFSGVASSSGGTGGTAAPKAGTDTSVDTGTIAVNVVFTDASAASSDMTLLGFTVEFFA